jgi:hypothetical protein
MNTVARISCCTAEHQVPLPGGGATMPKRLIAVLAVLVAAGAGAVAIQAIQATSAGASPDAVPAPGGSYVPVPRFAAYDSRTNGGISPNQDARIKVAGIGIGGIPLHETSAVVADVTVIDPANAGWLAVFNPTTGRNSTSTLNYTAKRRVTTMAVIGVDDDGYIGARITSQAVFSIQITGYFTTATTASNTAGLYNPLSPARIMDTRSHLGGTAPGPNGTTTLQVAGRGGVPTSGVSAVVLNVTVTGPTATGNVVAEPGGTETFGSTVDFVRGETRANRAIVALGSGGKVGFHNSAGTTQLVADVAGYFTDSSSTAGGSYFVPSGPGRLVDSRTPGQPRWSTPGITRSLAMTVDHGLRYSAASLRSVTPPTAILITITSVAPNASGYLTVYPGGTARPVTSDLNATKGALTNNLAVVGIGSNGSVNLYSNPAGNVVIDTSGYFARPPVAPTPAGVWATWETATVPATTSIPPAVRTNDLHGLLSIVKFRTGRAYGVRPDGTVASWTPADSPDRQPQPANPLDSSGSVQTVDGLTNVTALASPGDNADTGYALRSDGTVLSWGGTDFHGEIGRDGPIWYPAAINISNVTQLGQADQVGYAIKADGTVWAWGRNDTGQLGDGTTVDRPSPVQVAGLSNIISVSGDSNLSYAVDSGGRLWRWGTPYLAHAPIAPEQVTTACHVGEQVLGRVNATYERCFDGDVWILDGGGDSSEQHQLPDLSDITTIAPGPGWYGLGNILARRSDGTVWRYNDDTQHYEQVYGLSGISTIGGGVGAYYAVAG